MPTLIKQIATGNNDIKQSDFPKLVYCCNGVMFGAQSASPYDYRWQEFRYFGIDIPQGSNIQSAKLTFIAYPTYQTGGTPPDITFYCENEDTATRTSTSNLISNKQLTTNSVLWNNPAAFSQSEQVDSPDLTTIIQEIVNRSGWENGNAISIIGDAGVAPVAGNFNKAYEYDNDPTKAAILTVKYETPGGSITEITQPKTKQFFHKIFDKDGVYISTWAKEVINTPNFKWKVNGGMGEQKILLKREVKSFGENDDVKMGNIIETWIQDGDQEIGKLIWTGVLNRYEPKIKADGTEIIDVRGISKLIEYEKRIYQSDAGLTTDAKLTKSPDTILKEVITSKYGESLFQEGDIEATGTSVSFTFTSNTYREVLDNLIGLAPQHWYWRLLPDNTIDFKKVNYDEIDHKLYVGKEANNVVMTKSIETLINKVYFMGGGDPNLYRQYERTSSQSEFGLREKFIKDERVTVVATAETIATRILDNYDHPLSEISITVLDSNIDPKNGYDIERFKPGQIIQILHPEKEFGDTEWDDAIWDIDYWDFSITNSFGVPHQIVEIQYEFNQVVLRVSAKLEDTNKRIEDINRNAEETAKINIPVNPT